MKKLLVFCLSMLFVTAGFAQQVANVYVKGLSAAENLKAIANLGPYTEGGIGFDMRYQGVKGTPRMLDTLLPSFLRLDGQDYYIELMADLDLVNDELLYIHPKTRKMFSVPADIISEIIIKNDGKDNVYRTTRGKRFDKEMKEQKFYQVLKEGDFQFIKIPYKHFVQADYKGAYSADRRYDEFKDDAKYYLLKNDGIYYQIQLNRKSMSKMFPEKKKLIDQAFSNESDTDKEELILSILEKF